MVDAALTRLVFPEPGVAVLDDLLDDPSEGGPWVADDEQAHEPTETSDTEAEPEEEREPRLRRPGGRPRRRVRQQSWTSDD